MKIQKLRYIELNLCKKMLTYNQKTLEELQKKDNGDKGNKK